MKKIIFIAMVSAGMILSSYGQFFSIGPRLGLSSSSLQIDERLTINGEEVSYESDGSRFGFHIGAYARIMIYDFFIQPELLFTSASGRISFNSPSAGKQVQNLSYNKMDLPVLAGIRMGDVFKIQAGPVFSLILTDDARDIAAFEQARQNYRKSTIGYQAGIGLDISKVSLDLKYEGSLRSIGDRIDIGNESFRTDMRTSLIMLIAGFNIL